MPPELAGKDACPTAPAHEPPQVASSTAPVPAEGCRKLRCALVNASAPGGFDFLRHHLEGGTKWPRMKNLEKLQKRVRAKTPRLDERIQANTFTAVDGCVRCRSRSLLQWRLECVDNGSAATHGCWPNHWFARSGRWPLATALDWTRKIAPP